MAALGYTQAEIRARLADVIHPYTEGQRRLEDGYRSATISAAMGNDKHARDLVAEWVDAQRTEARGVTTKRSQ